MTFYAQPIFTLDARENVMLEVARDYFELDDDVMHREIQGMHVQLQGILKSKGIPYTDLKPALIPTIGKHEVGFIFNSQEIESSWYGYPVAEKIIPLFDPRSTHSVLCGDLIGNDQDFIFNVLDQHMILARSFDFVHGSALYCVYINNLSEKMLRHFHENLAPFPAYVGFIPVTYQSIAKTYLSTILVRAYIKCKKIVLMSHEDDLPNEENENILGYPFEEHGYHVKSIQSQYYGVFLSFKIERPVYKGFEVDTQMALNAVSPVVVRLDECSVDLDEAKHEYLLTKKIGKLEKAQIEKLSRTELEELIKANIAANYIYNMTYLKQHNVVKFNLIIEVPRVDGHPTKLMAALEYKPEEQVLRVITLF